MKTFLKNNYHGLLTLVRATLLLSILALLLSSVLMLSFGLDSEMAFGIMWFSVMGSIFVYYFSLLVLVGFVAYAKIKKEKVWYKIKPEVILLGLSILCMGGLALINNYVIFS